MNERVPVAWHVVERGEGLPVLSLHGWSPDHRIMLGCLEPIFANRPGYRRIYPDLPGMGGTSAPQWIASSDDLFEVVTDFVTERIGSAPFLVIGESYGGYLARALANALPDQVLGLALICPMGEAVYDAERTVPERQVLRPNPKLLEDVADRRLAEAFAGMAVVQTSEALRRFRDEVLPGLDAMDLEVLERIFRQWRLSVSPESALPYQRPTLIITGRQDQCVGYTDQYALLPHYPRATFAILDVAGHNAQIEQPRLFSELVTEWLDRVAAES